MTNLKHALRAPSLGWADSYYRFDMSVTSPCYFNSGGAGYSLSQAALRKFLAVMDDAQHCSAGVHTSVEDVMIARCFNYLGIQFTDTRDAKGRERLHPLTPGMHMYWKPANEGKQRDWYEDYNMEWGILLNQSLMEHSPKHKNLKTYKFLT